MPDITPMSFEEMRDAAAADLREVARLLNAKADEVAAGDMDAFYSVLVVESEKWLEMLAFRQAFRAERRELSVTRGALRATPVENECTHDFRPFDSTGRYACTYCNQIKYGP